VLKARILSALVLGPVALAVVWLGSPVFDLFVAGLAAVMVWEWDRMCRGRFGSTGKASAVVVAVAAAAVVHVPILALAMIWIGTLGAAVFSRSGWLSMGLLYIGLPVMALIWVRDASGMVTVFWLMGVIWATDIGAYFFGRGIGGPKLAPRISPKKTWAGLLGGMASAAVVGVGVPLLFGLPLRVSLAVFAAVLAAVAQLGDLLESSVKRRFNVKDSSNIIPGHGGVLDRVDGLIAAAPVVALMVLAYGGGVEDWQ